MPHGTSVHRPLFAAVFAIGIVLGAPPVLAQQGVTLTVSATVLKRATLTVLSTPSTVTVTKDDIVRGYVDAHGSAKLALKTNSGAGVSLEFSSHSDFVQAMRVQGMNAEIQMSAAGGFARHMAVPGTTEVLELRFRFALSEAAREGVYAWPVLVGVRPL
jgi:hypothetical protein